MIIYFLIQLAQDQHIFDYKCTAYLSRYVWKKPSLFSIASYLTYLMTIVIIASTFLIVFFYSIGALESDTSLIVYVGILENPFEANSDIFWCLASN